MTAATGRRKVDLSIRRIYTYAALPTSTTARSTTLPPNAPWDARADRGHRDRLPV